MAIKPILFNTEMVRAILDGRKTCTRRIIMAEKVNMNQYKDFKSVLLAKCVKNQIQLLPFEHERNAKYCEYFEERGGIDAEH